ncbi:MAG: cell envelope integrity protein TolA [Bacteroidota bacterium]
MDSIVIDKEIIGNDIPREEVEKKNKRKGLITSLIIHALLLLLLILPFMKFPFPPPGQEGIVVSFGMPEVGSGDDRPDTQQEENVKPTPPSAQTPTEEKTEEKETEATKPKAAEPTKSEPVDLLTQKNADVDLQAQKEQERIRQEKIQAQKLAEAERQRQREEAEAKKLAEEAARKKAAEEARKKAEYDAAKKQYGDLLGKGKGKTSTAGNQGDPGGDPDASQLEGISTGSGMIGGGLSNRGVKSEPNIQDNSQKTGKVVVKVCVDENGNVTSAQYTQLGSTTNDGDLKALAVESARKFKFTRSTTDKQCGTITIDFKLK